MDEYKDLAIGIIDAVRQAGDDKELAIEAVSSAIHREVEERKNLFRSVLILNVNNTKATNLDHSAVRLLINHVH